MKYNANDELGKKAWFSRVTAPVLKVDLVVKCKNLPKKDLLSQADGFCVLWKVPDGYTNWGANGIPNKEPGRQEEEIGRTEVCRSCINPTFKHKFRLNFVFHEEQTFVLRVFDEDLRYATGLSEHDYLGGFVFSLGQLMGAKGCSLAKRLGTDGKNRSGSYIVVTGTGVVEDREILEFRFSCQDLTQQHNIIIDKLDRSKVIDKCRPYFRLERLNQDDLTCELIWKSEVLKPTHDPVWNEARLPLQLLCNGNQSNPLKITIWDYDKFSKSHIILGFVESTVTEIIEKAKDGGIPVFIIVREKQKLFRRSKMKHVGLLKVLNASVMTVPSMLQYVSGGMSLDLMVGIDCSVANGVWGTEKTLHFSKINVMNQYQAGIKTLGTIAENFSRGRKSSLWGLGAEIDGKHHDCYAMKDNLCESASLLKAYNHKILNNEAFGFGQEVSLNPFIEAAIFRTIKLSKKRQCYTLLTVFAADDFVDLHQTIDLICTAAEDAPISILIIGVGDSDLNSVQKLCGENHKLLHDSRGIPIAREIVSFVRFKDFEGNAGKVIAEALKDVPEQFVQYQLMNGVQPLPPVPSDNYEKMNFTQHRAPPNRKNSLEISQSSHRHSSERSMKKASQSKRRNSGTHTSEARRKHENRSKHETRRRTRSTSRD